MKLGTDRARRFTLRFWEACPSRQKPRLSNYTRPLIGHSGKIPEVITPLPVFWPRNVSTVTVGATSKGGVEVRKNGMDVGESSVKTSSQHRTPDLGNNNRDRLGALPHPRVPDEQRRRRLKHTSTGANGIEHP